MSPLGSYDKNSCGWRWFNWINNALCNDNSGVSPAGVASPWGKTWGLLRSSAPTGWTWAWPADWRPRSARCSGGWTCCRDVEAAEDQKASCLRDRILFLVQVAYLIIRASMRKSNSSCSEQTSGRVCYKCNTIVLVQVWFIASMPAQPPPPLTPCEHHTWAKPRPVHIRLICPKHIIIIITRK